MIDPVLSQLTDDLKAAEAKLKSQDFGAKQARLVALEQEARDTIARIDAERETLAASLEGDEAAYENAQNALTAYIAANYLEGVNVGDDDMFDPEPPFAGTGNPGWNRAFDVASDLYNANRDPALTVGIGRTPDDDEYASAKSNGALTD